MAAKDRLCPSWRSIERAYPRTIGPQNLYCLGFLMNLPIQIAQVAIERQRQAYQNQHNLNDPTQHSWAWSGQKSFSIRRIELAAAFGAAVAGQSDQRIPAAAAEHAAGGHVGQS